MKSILIADDNYDIVDILKRRSESLGLRVYTAHDAMKVLSVATSVKPSAIILDVQMPQGNGLTVAEMLANHEDLRHVPVIILTGDSSQDVIRRCHQLCAYYIPKSQNIWSQVEPILLELLQPLHQEFEPLEMPRVDGLARHFQWLEFLVQRL